MAIIRGCDENRKTAELLEMECPKCKEILEVFVKDGKALESVCCEKCGFSLQEGETV